MDLSQALLAAVADPPPSTIDMDKLITRERRRARVRGALTVLACAAVLAAGVVLVPLYLPGGGAVGPVDRPGSRSDPIANPWWGSGDPPDWAQKPPCRPPDGESYVTGPNGLGAYGVPLESTRWVPDNLKPTEKCPTATRRLVVALDTLVRAVLPDGIFTDGLGRSVALRPDSQYGYTAEIVVDTEQASGTMYVSLAPMITGMPGGDVCAAVDMPAAAFVYGSGVACTHVTAPDGAVVVTWRTTPRTEQSFMTSYAAVRVYRQDGTVVDLSEANSTLVLSPAALAQIGQGSKLTLYP